MGRDAGVQHLRLDGLKQAETVCNLQASGIHGDQDVGWRVGTFVLDALQQFIFLAIQAIDLDAGLLGEVVVQRLIGLIVACRVDVEYRIGGMGSALAGQRDQGKGGNAGGQTSHVTVSLVSVEEGRGFTRDMITKITGIIRIFLSGSRSGEEG